MVVLKLSYLPYLRSNEVLSELTPLKTINWLHIRLATLLSSKQEYHERGEASKNEVKS